MKKLTILGVVFLSMTILFSCGDDKKSKKSKKDREISVKNLDKDIDNEEDAVEAMITGKKAMLELAEDVNGSIETIAGYKKRVEDIEEAVQKILEAMDDEKISFSDLEDADNWDEYEDLKDEGEDLKKEMEDFVDDAMNVIQTVYTK